MTCTFTIGCRWRGTRVWLPSTSSSSKTQRKGSPAIALLHLHKTLVYRCYEFCRSTKSSWGWQPYIDGWKQRYRWKHEYIVHMNRLSSGGINKLKRTIKGTYNFFLSHCLSYRKLGNKYILIGYCDKYGQQHELLI